MQKSMSLAASSLREISPPVTDVRSVAGRPVAAIFSSSSPPKRNVQPDSDDDARRATRLRTQLDENATQLTIVHKDVVRPLQPHIPLRDLRAQGSQDTHADRKT